MARIYYNAGTSGKNYSKLEIAKLTSGNLHCIIRSGLDHSNSVELNQDQIKDLLVQLESLKKTESMIEGSLDGL